MTTEEITKENYISIISNTKRRERLLAALKREEDSYLPLINHCDQIGQSCVATPEQLRDAVRILMKLSWRAGAHDHLLSPLVFHPHIPEDVLADLLNENRCLVDLIHRSGPLWLLERLAEKEPDCEAVTTLALNYYSQDEYSIEKFAEFLQAHKEDETLKYVLTRTRKLSPERWAVVYAAFDEDNR